MCNWGFRPRPQSNTIHPDEFKQFKLVVALSSRLPNHQDSSRITTVLLRFKPVHHDGATALLRIKPMHPDSAVAQNRDSVTGALPVCIPFLAGLVTVLHTCVSIMIKCISLFVCLLYVPCQQLWSLRDGQFT